MPADTALLMTGFWSGSSLTFVCLLFIRSLVLAERVGRTVPLGSRLLVAAPVFVGAFGYAGLVGNFVLDKNLQALSFLLGGAFGLLANYVVMPRSSTPRES